MTHVRHTMGHMTTQQVPAGRIPELTLGWRMKMALGDMSAKEMGMALGVSRQSLSRWMNDVDEPRRVYLLQWASVTGVDFDWLETGDGSPSGPTSPDGTPQSDKLAALTRAKKAGSRGRAGTMGATGKYLLPAA